MVILFLVPYLGLSAALPPVTPLIAAQLRMTAQALSLTSDIANAGYASCVIRLAGRLAMSLRG
jgi:hypothetical protein